MSPQESQLVLPAVEQTKTVPRIPKGQPTKPNDVSVGRITVTDDMPLSIRDNYSPQPMLLDVMETFTPLYKSNLAEAKQKIQEMDSWIKEDLTRQKYNLTVGAYKEYLNAIKKDISFSPHRMSADTLEQMYFYMKNVARRFNTKK